MDASPRIRSRSPHARGLLIAILAGLLALMLAGCSALTTYCPRQTPQAPATFPQYPGPYRTPPAPTYQAPPAHQPAPQPHVSVPPPPADSVTPSVKPGHQLDRVERIEAAVAAIAEIVGRQQEAEKARIKAKLLDETPSEPAEPPNTADSLPAAAAPPAKPAIDGKEAGAAHGKDAADAAISLGTWGLTALLTGSTGGAGLLVGLGIAGAKWIARRRLRAAAERQAETVRIVRENVPPAAPQPVSPPAPPVRAAAPSSPAPTSCVFADLAGRTKSEGEPQKPAERRGESVRLAADPVRETRTEFVRVPVTNGRGEALAEAVRRVVKQSPKLAPFAEQVFAVAEQIEHGARVGSGSSDESKSGWKND